MTIRFYSWPQSSGFGAHWALEELGLAYEYVRLDRANNEHRSAEYLVINPNGKVPALVDGEERYFESLAILLHLAERYGPKKGLWPAGGLHGTKRTPSNRSRPTSVPSQRYP